jgi:ABC-type nitrate/sulfonate/bicarbonate transport system permease component
MGNGRGGARGDGAPDALGARMRPVRIRRAIAGGVALLALYGIAAEIGDGRLPTRLWMGSHYVENVQLLPTFRSLAEEGAFLVESRILPESALTSSRRVLLGLVIGSLAGILLGLATGWAARLEYLADPWVTFFRFTPALALLPLFVVWFGYGETSKVLLIAASVAVITLLGAHQGVRRVPRVYLEAAASLGASPGLRFRKIVLPLAFPAIFASLRIAVGLAWVTIVVAELIDARMPSLGYLLALSGAYPRVPTMLIAIATIGTLVLAFDLLALLLHAHATRWMRRAG